MSRQYFRGDAVIVPRPGEPFRPFRFQDLRALELSAIVFQLARANDAYISSCAIVYDVPSQRRLTPANHRFASYILSESIECFPEFLLQSLYAALSGYFVELAMGKCGSLPTEV
jgi:hypothetical protein